ncbi:transcriptional regulator [Pseudomonas sp. 31-12]|uniref:histone-like nucleoid-structuring protein, MvaT/MvaU family n=1 Tax=Pseudomonas sp. 31-12 TaxID=2201356 RepID=UPI000D6C3088|nr:histone-like nucleoid-structuring protein, MvaT/MvaU family [Pseudomonas sp. 31-12]AWM92552.1 transcriptional regulator [Pseudomonas sp. 31-12]
MSKIAEFKALEAQLAEHMRQLDEMKNDDGLKKEIEFETKLRALMGEYSVSLPAIIALLDPSARRSAKPSEPKLVRKARSVKRYKNPHTGELIETKGGNHKLLKEWKTEHGGQEVESWLQ